MGAVAAVIVMGCVSGDDTSGKPQGSLGGACFANNTCNAGLSCVLESGVGVCEPPDATVEDAPSDQSTQDAPAEGASDAGSEAEAEAGCSVQPDAACPSGCSSELCCITTETCTTAAQCTDPNAAWSCSRPSDCNGSHCCVALAFSAGCPLVGQLSSTAACNATCGGSQICLVDQDCGNLPGTSCKAISLVGTNVVTGICTN
jgi:hypothetical protein